MRLKAKLAVLFAALAVALGCVATVSTAAAQASVSTHASVAARVSVSSKASAVAVVPDADGALECSGDVCIQSQCAGCNIQNINAWANRTTFTGHFELCFGFDGAGGCTVDNSPTRTWPAGGTHWVFTGIPGAAGSACVTAWKDVSGGYTNIGEECFGL